MLEQMRNFAGSPGKNCSTADEQEVEELLGCGAKAGGLGAACGALAGRRSNLLHEDTSRSWVVEGDTRISYCPLQRRGHPKRVFRPPPLLQRKVH